MSARNHAKPQRALASFSLGQISHGTKEVFELPIFVAFIKNAAKLRKEAISTPKMNQTSLSGEILGKQP